VRRPIIAGAALLVAGLGGCAVSASSPHPEWNPKAGLPFAEPDQLRASNGVLAVDLSAERRVVDVSGSALEAQPFNRRLLGPTLHVAPGDRLEVTLDNGTGEPTNIHYHGLHVSPRGTSDNVFRAMEPGVASKSVVEIPRDHDPGTFWYHVHYHGTAESQVSGGLAGMLIVEGLEERLPEGLRDVPQRQLLIRDVQHEGGRLVFDPKQIDPTGAGTTKLVNGLLRPRLELRPGAVELWRIANVGANLGYDVALDGHEFRVIAEDGSPVWKTWTADHLRLPPGKRFDVLVRGGPPGRYAFRTREYDEGFELLPRTRLADVTVRGRAVRRPLALPRRLPTPAPPIADRPVRRKREFTFSFASSGPFRALINGEQWDAHETNVAPRLGSVEEWTLRNPSSEDHPFHIHVNDFQVMSVNGRPYRANGLQDVVVIPKNGGEVVIRNPFDDFTGHYVFHCHILGHEDAGMMQNVQVVRKGEQPSPPPSGHGIVHAVRSP
jgi:suppressor of ftsI